MYPCCRHARSRTHGCVYAPMRVPWARRGSRVCHAASRAHPGTGRASVPTGRRGGTMPQACPASLGQARPPRTNSLRTLRGMRVRLRWQGPEGAARGAAAGSRVDAAAGLGAECPECEAGVEWVGEGSAGLACGRRSPSWERARPRRARTHVSTAPATGASGTEKRETELMQPESSRGVPGTRQLLRPSFRAVRAQPPPAILSPAPRLPPHPADILAAPLGNLASPSGAHGGSSACVGGSGGSWQSLSVAPTHCHDL